MDHLAYSISPSGFMPKFDVLSSVMKDVPGGWGSNNNQIAMISTSLAEISESVFEESDILSAWTKELKFITNSITVELQDKMDTITVLRNTEMERLDNLDDVTGLNRGNARELAERQNEISELTKKSNEREELVKKLKSRIKQLEAKLPSPSPPTPTPTPTPPSPQTLPKAEPVSRKEWVKTMNSVIDTDEFPESRGDPADEKSWVWDKKEGPMMEGILSIPLTKVGTEVGTEVLDLDNRKKFINFANLSIKRAKFWEPKKDDPPHAKHAKHKAELFDINSKLVRALKTYFTIKNEEIVKKRKEYWTFISLCLSIDYLLQWHSGNLESGKTYKVSFKAMVEDFNRNFEIKTRPDLGLWEEDDLVGLWAVEDAIDGTFKWFYEEIAKVSEPTDDTNLFKTIV